MVDINLLIIEALKNFLDEYAKNQDLRKLVTSKPTDFSRNRKLTFKNIAGMIINFLKRSLSLEIKDFFKNCVDAEVSCTKGAFSAQRTKLDPSFFKAWNKCLVENFYHHYGDSVRRWKGFIVQAVDGSTANLVNRPDVVAYFGTHNNQYGAVPMARVMEIYDVLNNIIVWADLFPIKQSEQHIMATQVGHLAEDSLTLFDRGYPSFSLLYLMLKQKEAPRSFVMRCKEGFNKTVKEFVSSGKEDQTIDFYPDKHGIIMLEEQGHIVDKNTSIKIRMVKVILPTGVSEVLLTNLYDENLYTKEDLYYLYGLRWGIETRYNRLKNQQQLEQFSGHRTICIQQDYAATILTANLQSLVIKQCQPYVEKVNAVRKREYKINHSTTLGDLKHELPKLFLENSSKEILEKLQEAFQHDLVAVIPNRTNERVKKPIRTKGKYKTFTNYKRAL